MHAAPTTSYNNWSDTDLSAALSRGDEGAFAQIYERFWLPLHRMAYQKTGSKETAEELVQDLFLRLWQRRESLSIDNLPRYLFAALKFSIIDWIESKAVHERFVAYSQAFSEVTSNDAEGELALQDLTKTVDLALITLPEKTQDVFRLSRYGQLTIPEIAARLGLSDKAVEYHLTRALGLVRAHLRAAVLVSAGFAELF